MAVHFLKYRYRKGLLMIGSVNFNPEDLSNRIIRLLLDRAINPSGHLVKSIDLRTGNVVDPTHNDDELGDYVEYIYWLGMNLHQPDYTHWATKHISDTYIEFEKDLNNGVIWDVSACDRIIGPVQVLLMDYSETISNSVDRYFSLLFDLAVTQNGLIRTMTGINRSSRYPVADPMTTGNHIELLSELYMYRGKQHFLDMAIRIMKPWLGDGSSYSNGMFHRQSIGFLGVTASALKNFMLEYVNVLNLKGFPSYILRVTKQNTHFLFGLIRYFEATGEKKAAGLIDNFISGVQETMLHDSGLSYQLWDGKRNLAYHIDIGASISLIELLLDAYRVFQRDKYLKMAENYALGILHFKGKLGIIPQFPLPEYTDIQTVKAQYSKKKAEADFYNLDPQVDFAVNLAKLYELTGKQEYSNAFSNLANSIIENFSYGLAFTEILDKGVPSPTVKTKYLGLFLKLCIVIIAGQKKISIISDPHLALVCQDR